jgi:recombination protein RecA
VDLSADRSTQFRQALDAIHRRWGDESLRPLATLNAASACVPTGYPELDRAIGGGIPCGKITELSGIPTCGATTLTLKVIAQAQLQGRLGVYIDLARSLDPGYAARCGVLLDGLLIARPDNPASALDILQIVAEEGGASLAILDCGGRAAPRWSLILVVRLHR